MSRNEDPLEELNRLMGEENPFGIPDEEVDFEPGLVGIYDSDTGKLLNIRYLTKEEKDTLRQIAGEITHYRIFKR